MRVNVHQRLFKQHKVVKVMEVHFSHSLSEPHQGTATSSSNPSISRVIDDKASSTSSSPCQPADITFPVTYFSGKAQSFNPQWFRLYPWLEYSVSNDAAFCYACSFLVQLAFLLPGLKELSLTLETWHWYKGYSCEPQQIPFS